MLSDYAEQRRAKIRAINAKNKSRSADMERRVMKYLKGRRVPMSGSGSIKGDGQLYCDKGYVYIECKMSAALGNKGPIMRISFTWLFELAKYSKVMCAAINALVYHCHKSRLEKDYVLMPVDIYQKLTGDMDKPSLIVDKSQRRSWLIHQCDLEDMLPANNSIIGLESNRGLYIIMRLPYFKYLLHGDEDEF
jgi:hypothetical protein